MLSFVRIASVGAGFLTNVIGAHLIGPAGLGAAGAALTIATIGAISSNLGLNIATIYLLGRSPDERATIVGRVALLSLIVASGATIVVLAAALLLRTSVLGGAGLDLAVTAAMLGAGLLLFELTGGMLLGLHRRRAYIVVQVIEAMVALALTGPILLFVSRSASGFLGAAALAYWIGVCVSVSIIWRELGRISLQYSGQFTRDALRIGLRGQIGNILQFLNLRLDLLLIPALLNLSSAGVYLVAVRVSEVLTQVSGSAASLLFPHVAAQAERDATATTERAARVTLLTVLAGGVVLALIAEPLLGIAFGPEFARGSLTVRITLAAMIPLSIVRLLAGDLKGRGRPGLVSIAAFVAVIATVTFDLWLIPAFGIEGAALASLLTYSTSATFLLVAYRRITGARLVALVPRGADVLMLVREGSKLLRTIGRSGRP